MRLTQKSFQNLLRQLIGAAVIIFLLVMVLMLVPAHSLEKSLHMWMSFLPPSDILHWKSAVDREISLVMKLQGSILISRLLALTLRHTTRIYIRYFQSILIVVLSSRLVPVVMTQLYIVAPAWLTEMSDNMISEMGRSFSADDGECPDLVLDPHLADTLGESRDDLTTVGSLLATNTDSSDGGASKSRHGSADFQARSFSTEDVETFNRLSKQGNGSNGSGGIQSWALNEAAMNEMMIDTPDEDHQLGGGEAFVFDPQYGVIPASSRDRWRELQAQRAERDSSRQGEGGEKRQIPPVRYSSCQQ